MTGCLFCEIVGGDKAAHIVLEDSVAVGFLDTRPVFHGHTLLVPRDHYGTLADLPPEMVGPLFERAQRLARAMEYGLRAGGTFVAMNNKVSQSVPHLHVHVVPRTKGDGLRGFFWPRRKYASEEEAASYAERIRAALSSP